MSRIRGIEARIPKDTLQVRNSRHEVLKRVVEDNNSKSKDAAEKRQINELLQKLPKLDKIFEVHKKIGEGTFSSVYLGSLRQHATLSDSEKKWFAIKHLVPTAHPARIEHELRCLQDMGGKNHVIGVELCLRHLDTIVFVMPYIPHKKFSEYIVDMDAAELQRYMRALLTALRHVHSFGVIHRDVKPSNFLYDRENQRYLLVDFGLAQRMCPAPDEEPPPPTAHSNSLQKRPRDQDDSAPGAKRMALDLSLGARANADRQPTAQPETRPDAPSPPATRPDAPSPPATRPDAASPPATRPDAASPPATRPDAPSPPATRPDAPSPPATRPDAPSPPATRPPVRPASQPRLPVQVAVKVVGAGVGAGAGAVSVTGGGACACACAGRGAVCAACARRNGARAPRAGTQGFRPPEVLLKVCGQGTGVDTWAAGVVLASVLTRRYPFFRAPDDVTALAELADLLGTEPLQEAALAMGRRIVTSSVRRGLCLRKLCARLRGAPPPAPAPAPAPAPCRACSLPPARCLCRDEGVKAEEVVAGAWVCGFPDAAFALAAALLQPLPAARASAAAALHHPFFTQPL